MANIGDISVFGNKKQPENRVTDALLMIVNRGKEDLTAYLFEDCCDIETSEFEVTSQVNIKDTDSKPDGLIRSTHSKYSIFIESKLTCLNENPNSHDQEQLKKHLSLPELNQPVQHVSLLYITNDETCPKSLEEKKCVGWINWKTIVAKLLKYAKEISHDVIISYLANEFAKLVEEMVHNFSFIQLSGTGSNSNLPELSADDAVIQDTIIEEDLVAIVGGRWAAPVADKFGFYACQPGRYFKPNTKYFAFYYDKKVQSVYKILSAGPKENCKYLAEKDIIDKGYLGYLSSQGVTPDPNELVKLFWLVPVEESLPLPIVHLGGSAFVQKQRYTTLDKIRSAKTTADL